MASGGVLCVDIGSGTQDALYWFADRSLENCPKFVLPSPAKRIDARIRGLTAAGRAIYLCGRNMGGGFIKAVKAHREAGLPICAHPRAALAITDDPASLQRFGITLSDVCPQGHEPVHLADYDPGFWNGLLALAGLEPPSLVLACAQDHGHHPGASSRLGRFALWREALAGPGARLEAMLYERVPGQLTRLQALQDSIGGGPVMDSGPAAALGVLFEPELEAAIRAQGALIVNMGNSHTLGLLVRGGALAGVYEHHTGQIGGEALRAQLERFRQGRLDTGEVFSSGGHGCTGGGEPEGFPKTYVIGPRRGDFPGRDAIFPAPGGDMMLAGCFGLLKAWQALHPLTSR